MEGDTGDYARRTERIKNLLSSYYGNAPPPGSSGGPEQQQLAGAQQHGQLHSGAAAAPGGASPEPGHGADAGGGQTPEQHVAALIRSQGLARLLSEHRSMAREIKHLDSDMQQLVYENYNKFIAATDTIRDMKAGVDGMQADMERLAADMDTVAQRSAAVNAKLLKRRAHIEELNRLTALLDKLQVVFDLPSRMRAALEEDALGTAVAMYAEAAPLLRRHGSKPALRRVAAEAEAAAREVAAQLQRRLAERKQEDAEALVLLLRQLGEADESLQEKYLAGRAERMRRILAEAAAVAGAMAAGGAWPPPPGQLPGVEEPGAWCAGGGGPPSVPSVIKALDERLIGALQETAVNVTNIFLQDDGGASRRAPLVAMAKGVLAEYFSLIRRVVGDAAAAAAASAACLPALEAAQQQQQQQQGWPPGALAFSADWGADAVAKAMSAVSTDIGLLHNQLPELSLRPWAADVTQQVVSAHVAAAFGALQKHVATALRRAQAQLSQPGSEQVHVQLLAPAYNHLSEAIQRGTAALIKVLAAYEQHGKLLGGWREQLGDVVQGQLAALFACLTGAFLSLAKIKDASLSGSRGGEADAQDGDGSGTDSPPKTGLVLLLAKLCLFMESSVVPAVMEALAAGAAQGHGGTRGGDQPPPFVGGEVARRLGTAANLLLACFVDLHSRSLALLLGRSVASTNWLHAAPPRGPRPVCDLLLERLGRAAGEVGALVEAPGRGGGGGHGSFQAPGGPHHARRGSGADVLESGAVTRGVARLFRGKVGSGLLGGGAGGPPAFTQSGLLGCVMGGGLKALLEYVRLQTLGTAGLQQLQLDVAYLTPRLLAQLGPREAEALAALADEVVAAGAGRCLEPALLEPALLAKALAAASREG